MSSEELDLLIEDLEAARVKVLNKEWLVRAQLLTVRMHEHTPHGYDDRARIGARTKLREFKNELEWAQLKLREVEQTFLDAWKRSKEGEICRGSHS